MSTPSEPLLPCPFCGVIPHMVTLGRQYYIECANTVDCNVWPISNKAATPAAAYAAWNNRVSPEERKRRYAAAAKAEREASEELTSSTTL